MSQPTFDNLVPEGAWNTVTNNTVKGGHLRFADATARDALVTAQIAAWGGTFSACAANERSILQVGQTCDLISDGKTYRLNSSGTWEDKTPSLKAAEDALDGRLDTVESGLTAETDRATARENAIDAKVDAPFVRSPVLWQNRVWFAGFLGGNGVPAIMLNTQDQLISFGGYRVTKTASVKRTGVIEDWLTQEGRSVLSLDYWGRFNITLTPEAVGRSLAQYSLPSRDFVVTRQLPGTMTDIYHDYTRKIVHLKSDFAGFGFEPWLMRSDVLGPGLLRDIPDNKVDVFLDYGQSWIVAIDEVNFTVLGIYDSGEPLAMGWGKRDDNDLLPPLAQPFWVNQAGEIRNLSTYYRANNGSVNACGNIAQTAAQTMMRYGRLYGRKQLRTLVSAVTGYGSQFWDGLRPDGTAWNFETGAAVLDPGTGASFSPWAESIVLREKLDDILEATGKIANYVGLSWHHGAYADGVTDRDGVSDYRTILDAVLAAFDALDLPRESASALPMFMSLTPGVAGSTKLYENTFNQIDFAEDNPTRVFAFPRSAYPYKDLIHHTGNGSWQIGELEGMIRHIVIHRGLQWRPPTITAIAHVGGKIRCTVSTMSIMGGLEKNTTLIEQAPGWGCNIRKSDGSFVAVTAVDILSDTMFEVTPASGLTGLGTIEFSYGYRGPGSSSGVHSGVWGNLFRRGLPSVWRADRAPVLCEIIPYKGSITL